MPSKQIHLNASMMVPAKWCYKIFIHTLLSQIWMLTYFKNSFIHNL